MSTTHIPRPLDKPLTRPAEARGLPDHPWSAPGQWIQRLALPLLVLLQVLLALRLDNTPSDDEALYIQSGREILAHWRTGADVVDFGTFFSGAPAVYPVVAALLDDVGGLWLVRAFSLACIVVSMACTRATARHLFGRTAGDFAGLVFALTGPIIFLSALATFDALCLMLLSLGLWIGLTRRSPVSAVSAGFLLAAATVVKYTGVAFVPVVLIAILMSGQRSTLTRRCARVSVIATITAVSLITLYSVWGAGVHDGIFYTTTNREALNPAPVTQLIDYVIKDIGLLIVLAIAGGVFVVRSLQSTLFLLALFAGGFGLVLSQLYLGEAMSFEKHTAFSALFLAPLAGRTLAALARPKVNAVLPVALIGLLLVSGLSRSSAMHHKWPSVERVATVVSELIAEDPQPGDYFSTQASQLRYYTYEDYPQTKWTAHYSIYDSSSEGVRQLVEERAFEMIVWRSGSTGNPREDALLEEFRSAVLDSPHYSLAVEPIPLEGWADEEWYVFELDR